MDSDGSVAAVCRRAWVGVLCVGASAGVGLSGFEYAHDNGSGNVNIGPAFAEPAEMLWGNYFEVEGGYNTITSVSVAWGSIEPGLEAQLLVFDDPDNDLDPGNAQLLASTTGLTAVPQSNEFVEYPIGEVQVSGGFFVGVLMEVDNTQRPGRLDTQTISGRSWLFFDDRIDVGDLGGSPYILNMDDAPFPGTWMVRAGAVPSPGGAAVLGAAGLLVMSRGRRRVEFDR